MSNAANNKSELIYTPISEIKLKVERQKSFFQQGISLPLQYRKNALTKLLSVINEKEGAIMEALQKDFRKSAFETYETEIGLVKSEIKLSINNLEKWSKKSFIGYSLLSFYAKLYTQAVPLGNSLIISPWNYPFLLLFSPLVGSVAAGNTVLLKPSELTPHMAKLSEEIIALVFDQGHVDIVQGAIIETETILNQHFNFIFFTGSTKVGKIVNQKAAENLTPVVLELGGKSPCIVNQDADIKTAAKRITWGKFLNGGQTCVAPDYLLVHKNVKNSLREEIIKSIVDFYGKDASQSPDFPRIINKSHFQRISAFIKDGKLLYGGNTKEEELYIEPTLVEVDSLDSPVMNEEIFGPVLPIIEFESVMDIKNLIDKNSHPLALYVFSANRNFIEEVLRENTSGDVCINDVVSHFGEKKFGVGGVGNSGMGKYHGKESFYTFSHKKSILQRRLWPDLPLRYPPYKNKLGLLKALLNKL